VEAMRSLIAEAIDFCSSLGVDIEAILDVGHYYDRANFIGQAPEKILAGGDEAKKRFLLLAKDVDLSLNALHPHSEAAVLKPPRDILVSIARRLEDESIVDGVDINELSEVIGELLDDSILTTRYVIHDEPLAKQYDLSQIDFEALRLRFEQGQKRTSVEKLRAAMKRKLEKMVEHNRTRMSYLEQFSQMIEQYNAGASGVDEVFSHLLKLVDEINEEEQRAIAEGLSEEELAVFDLLIRPKKTLSDKERGSIKETAKLLLEILKSEKLKLDWRKHDVSQAAVRVEIENILDNNWPDSYENDIFENTVEDVYQHIVNAYPGGGRSVYEDVA
jgi:type I restriction enzyme, R subunit